ncbi:MAG: Histidine-tRNA ligase [Candidatus Uhrbacteria bacterium GW2011_GWB1_41_7]|nr:MAG: Histidine-tRNA ligase [Candidatus Uhrbacteria bacterium GW2011_GWB1_41_7]
MIAKNVDAKAGDRKAVKTPQLLRGFKDILPGEEPYWNAVEDAARNIATSYSFGRLRLPILEQTSLFERSIGKATDVVEKEMYTFVDPSNTRVTLRPEATAGAARAPIL